MKVHCALLLSVLAFSTAVASEVSVDDLIKHAKQLDGQRVTVRGIAEDGGDKLFIWADYKARLSFDMKRQFSAWLGELPPDRYAYANACWVRVTGVVRLNLKTWRNEPFGLELEKVHVLSPRIRSLLKPLAYIRNDTDQEIQLQVHSASSRGGTLHMAVRPHSYAEGEPEKGGSVSVTYENGRTARFGPITRSQWKNYFDPRKRAYYFRITDDKIELVRPAEARSWHWNPDPDRD